MDKIKDKVYLSALVVCSVAILVLSITPTTTGIINYGFINHLIAYFVLSSLLSLYLLKKRISKPLFKAALLTGFYGFLIEMIQFFIPYRYFQFYDILTNFTGAFLVFIVFFFHKMDYTKHKTTFRISVIVILSCLFFTILSFIFVSKSKLTLALIALVVFILTFKRIKLGIYLSILSLPLIPRIPEKLGTANFSIAELIVLVVLFSWFLRILIGKQFTFKKTKLDLPIILFLILACISFLYSLQYVKLPLEFSSSVSNLYPLKALLNIFEYVLFFYLIVNVFDKDDIKKVVGISLISLFIVSLVGIYQYNKIFSIGNFFGFKSYARIPSTFNAYTLLGVYLILFIPLIFYFLRKYYYKILIGFPSLLCLLYSGSRGAFYSLLGSMLITCKKNKKTILLFIVLFILLLPFIFLFKENIITKRISDYGDSGRFEIYNSSLNMLLKNPMGIGLGSFRLANVIENAHHAHNLYLQIALEGGIIALIVFLWIFFVFLKGNISAKATDNELGSIRLALLTGVTAVLIHGLVDYPFYSQRIALLFWTVMAMTWKLTE